MAASSGPRPAAGPGSGPSSPPACNSPAWWAGGCASFRMAAAISAYWWQGSSAAAGTAATDLCLLRGDRGRPLMVPASLLI